MSGNYFKYKAISLTSLGELDQRSVDQVIEPIAQSYFYLPTRAQLNDPNEGAFQNQIQANIAEYLQGVVGFGETADLAKPIYDLELQISQSTDKSGVFSLSSNVKDELLWAHYAASHYGIAIEYNLDQLTRFCSKEHLHRFRVDYVDKPPILDMQHLQYDAKKGVQAMLGHKSRRWKYEEEFRVLLENIHGPIPHDYRAVRSITFGLKVSKEIRTKIYEATKHKVLRYYEIVKIADTYLLDRSLLEESGECPKGEKSAENWEEHFHSLNQAEKEKMIEIAQLEIEDDPHFEELLLIDKSTEFPSKVVLMYQVHHHLGLKEWSKYTKYFYDL